MSDLASHAATVFMAFFALVNPVPLTEMFIGITVVIRLMGSPSQ